MEEKDYNKISLFEFIKSSKKHTWSVIGYWMFAILFFIGAWTSTDLGWGQPVIMVGSILWGGLIILQKYLILKKLRKDK